MGNSGKLDSLEREFGKPNSSVDVNCAARAGSGKLLELSFIPYAVQGKYITLTAKMWRPISLMYISQLANILFCIIVKRYMNIRLTVDSR